MPSTYYVQGPTSIDLQKGVFMNPSCKLRHMSVCSFFCALVVCLTLVLGLGTTLAWAQATSTSTVTGQVVDQQGAAVPGAEVKLTDTATSTELTTLTNTDGRYVFVNVQPATYNLAFSKAGFAKARVEAQKVEVGTTLTVTLRYRLAPLLRRSKCKLKRPPSCRRAVHR